MDAGLPATLAGFEDEATFAIVLNEERLGTARSSWAADGRFEARSTITLAGQTVESSIRVVPDADGRWREIVAVAPDAERASRREGSAVTRVARTAAGRETVTTFETPDGALLFDNDAPALIAQAVRRYDRARGGPQAFAALIGGRPPVPLTVEATERAERTVAGRDLALTRYRYGVPGADLYAWAEDGSGRVLLVEIPAQHAAFVREGYESLRRPVVADPLLSAPAHEVTVERGVMVPTRDGLALATDVYRPAGVERAPVILVRTPYSRAMLELQGRFYARRGYAYAAQDCRGCFDSPGAWEPFVHEGADGYDAVEWLAARPWADGRVGMLGASYLALAQWLAAAERPPHLVALVPNVSPSDPFRGVPYEHGALALFGTLWWAEALEGRVGADLSGAALSRLNERRRLALLRALPVAALDEAALGAPNPYWRAWVAHPDPGDPYWARASFLDRLADVRLPVFHQSGWFDDNGLGTKHNYLRMAAHGHPHQKLTLGPWGHTDTASRAVGDRHFGEAAEVDLQRDYLRWFDRWLKGVDNGIDREPLVSLFVMGANRWLRGDAYPLPGTRVRKLYLASAGGANTSLGDGRLTFDPPDDADGGASADRYAYDPGDPTPAWRLYEEPEGEAGRARTPEERRAAWQAHRRELVERRRDILVYQTEPLDEPLTFAGPLSAELYAATSARDTDWVVTLSEVRADGSIDRLTQGVLRARYRDCFADPPAPPSLLEPGAVYRYTVDCWHTAVSIPAGARLRVEVASAAFPMFSRNLGTGEHNETGTAWVAAEQTVYHDAARPSHLLLPVVQLA